MKRAAYLIIILLISFTLFPRKQEWAAITGKDWEITRGPGEESHALILFDKCWKDDLHGTKFRFYRRMKILDASGVDEGNVSVKYGSKWAGTFMVKGRTLHPDGSVYYLDEKNVYTKRIFDVGRRARYETTFVLPRVVPGCILEYEYRYWSDKIEKTFVRSFQREHPVLLSEFHWRIDRDYNCRYLLERVPNDHLTIAKEPLDAESPKKLHFTVTGMPAIDKEAFTRPKRELTATGYFFYTRYHATPQAFWNHWADEISFEVESFGKKAKSLPPIFDGLPEDLPVEEKLSHAYSFLQEKIQNTSYLTKEQEKSDKYKNRRAISTFDQMTKHGYGSYFDINAGFIAMARYLGLEADIVAVTDRTEGYFKDSLFRYDQFDNLVVAVKYPDGTYRYHDPGTWYLPFGRLEYIFQGAGGLMAGEGAAFLIDVPFDRGGDNLNKHSMDITINDDFSARVDYRAELAGQSAYTLCNTLFDKSGLSRKEILERWIGDFFDERVEVEEHFVGLPEKSGGPVVMKAAFTLSNIVEPAGSRFFVRPAVLRGGLTNPFMEEERKNIIIFDYPKSFEDRVVLTPPAGFSLDDVPEDILWKNSLGKYYASFEEKEGKLHYRRFWKRELSLLVAEKYKLAKDFYEHTVRFDQSRVVFREKE